MKSLLLRCIPGFWADFCAADFPVCRLAGFPARRPSVNWARPPNLATHPAMQARCHCVPVLDKGSLRCDAILAGRNGGVVRSGPKGPRPEEHGKTPLISINNDWKNPNGTFCLPVPTLFIIALFSLRPALPLNI
jgi:hypothetical protein